MTYSMLGIAYADMRLSYEHRNLHEPAILYVELHNEVQPWLTDSQVGRRFYGGRCRERKATIPSTPLSNSICREIAMIFCPTEYPNGSGLFVP